MFRIEHPGKTWKTEIVELRSPDQFKVEGRPNSNLLQDLRWYLEDFLSYPYPPYTDIAERVLKTLKCWGEQIFNKLFSGQARDWYKEVLCDEGGLTSLTVKITSDDPHILAWPWEALSDPDNSTLAFSCCFERQLNDLNEPLPLSTKLARDCINILLIISRPFGASDVGYLALSRPLFELFRQKKLPINIDVLRPPTIAQLRQVLDSKPDYYHIVHFDGHGSYDAKKYSDSPYTLGGTQNFKKHIIGYIAFENQEGTEDWVAAEKLAKLLNEYCIPVVMLNSCQSASVDVRAKAPFASVAAALLKAGIRSVVAMGYNLYVRGAQQFVPAYYKRFFSSGSVAEAVRAGRQAMRAVPKRDCALGEVELEDWLVPVAYGLEVPLSFTFEIQQSDAKLPAKKSIDLPQEAKELSAFGFLGREREILALERALRLQPQAGLLIHGMAGIGKTTLIQGFLTWLSETNGLHFPPFWFQFDNIRSAEFVLNRLVSQLFETSALAASMEQKIDALIRVLFDHPFLLVWDSFESASGIAGTDVVPQLSEGDRQVLENLLIGLRGGKTKILITSRSQESWLSRTCFRLSLGGLTKEDSWRYCNSVVRELELSVDRNDPIYVKLIEMLGGHPLAMRAVLLRLPERDAHRLKKDLESEFAGAEADESTRRIDAVLNLLADNFPAEFTVPLQYVGLHQQYVDIDWLGEMIRISGEKITEDTLRAVFTALENIGLLHQVGNGIYSMHPTLNSFLRRRYTASITAIQGFVDFMAHFADQLAPKELHEQRIPFEVHGGNFFYALSMAKMLNNDQAFLALTQAQAVYFQNSRDFRLAQKLFMELAAYNAKHGNQTGEVAAYHQLGMIAQEQRDFRAAESWYKKSLAIEEKKEDLHRAAITYYQLGMIAQELRDFNTAENWYKKSLAIEEKQVDEHGAAITYHQLGIIAQEQRDFQTAESWYKKSLAIKEKQGDEHGAAITYQQLGRIAQEQRDFQTAESWYKKSLAIKEKQGNEHGAAITYHQLGILADEQGNFQAAESWYKKSLAIKEKQGDEHGAAITYQQLGRIAQEQRDFQTAESWYKKSLAIKEKQGNEHGAAITYHQLGRIAQEQGDFQSAESWSKKSLAIFEKQGDEYNTAIIYHQLGMLAQEQGDFQAAESWYKKSLAIKEKQGDEHGAAITHGQIGLLALRQNMHKEAGKSFRKAASLSLETQDEQTMKKILYNYIDLLRVASDDLRSDLIIKWNKSGLPNMPPWENIQEMF